MTKTAEAHGPSKSAVRTRVAVLAVGMGASLALGSGAALAAEATSSNDPFAVEAASELSRTLEKQAEQQKAAAAKVAAAEKAAADAKKRAAAEQAADRAKRQPPAWVKPVDNYIKGSTFGLGGSYWSNKHSGQDLVVGTGTSVKAVHQGTVVQAGWGGAYGNNIVIRHDAHTYTQYAHLSKIGVRIGQSVNVGQEIAKSGSTGNSTGPHLHFETRTTPNYGSGVDPVPFMRGHGVSL
jgi:murein DD-endopeptidase MepM/ murein hydrolase activator NlpD